MWHVPFADMVLCSTPAGGADRLAGEPLEQAVAAEAVAAGHQAVCGYNALLAHRAAELVLHILQPVILQRAKVLWVGVWYPVSNGC
jgi:hypothetical protein